ncbi:MAG TPA: alkaline phosphatase family protein [Candidatus Tumulicola sp.]
MRYAALLAFALIVFVAACATQPQSPTIPSTAASAGLGRHPAKSTPIQHVVIIYQENRTPDDLFQAMAAEGADIQSWAIDSNGDKVNLKQVSLATSYDLGHGHASFIRDYDCGKMDGFDFGLAPQFHMRPFSYAPLSEVRPYVDMAKQYVFADRMFETQQAGSFPAHQEIVSGTASGLPETTFNVSSDPYSSKTLKKVPAGCDGPALGAVDTIDPSDGSAGPTPRPCFNRPVLTDFFPQRGITWRYYQNGLGPGLWHAFDAIKHVRYGPDYANVVTPPMTILSDIATNALPNMSWVMPADSDHSDHPGNRSADGPSWVAAIVNAIGESKYWNTTAIVITWDDWGGMYDHVPPPMMNNWYELGFRVPMIVVSPYAKRGYVSHVQYEFGSILAFAEETFGIRKGALNASDARANDLKDAFNFKQHPRPFVAISAPPFVPGKKSPSIENAEDPDGDSGVAPATACMTGRRY